MCDNVKGVPRTVPGRVHVGGQTPVLQGTLHRMEAGGRGRKLVLHRLLVRKIGHQLNRPDPQGAGPPSSITASSGGRQSVPPAQKQAVQLQQLQLLLHQTCHGLAPRQLRLLRRQHTRRASQITEQMFSQGARPRDTLEERLVEWEVLVQDLPSPTMATDTPGDHRVASHAQPRRIESSLDPEAPVGKQRRQWLAGQLGWLPTRHVVGRLRLLVMRFICYTIS